MPSVRYVGPIDEVDVVGVGVLKRGDDVEVTAELAGSAPSVSKDADGNEVHDLGSGLLAQPDNFVSTPTPAEKKKG